MAPILSTCDSWAIQDQPPSLGKNEERNMRTYNRLRLKATDYWEVSDPAGDLARQRVTLIMCGVREVLKVVERINNKNNSNANRDQGEHTISRWDYTD